MNVAVWLIVSLVALTVILLEIPAVQRYIAGEVTAILSKTLGTRAVVGNIKVTLPGRITADNVVIYDQSGKEMLKANRLSANADILALTDGRIEITSAQLFGAKLDLYKQNDSVPANFQFVIDSLSSKESDEKKPLNLHIGSLIIRRSSVKYDRLDAPQTEGRLNPNHIYVSDISGHFRLRSLTNDSVNAEVKKLSLKEQSGLALNRLTFKITSGKDFTELSEFIVRLPNSELSIDKLTTSHDISAKSFSLSELKQTRANIDGNIHLSDFRFLVPTLANEEGSFSVATTLRGEQYGIALEDLLITASQFNSPVTSGRISGSASLHSAAGLTAGLQIASNVGQASTTIQVNRDSTFTASIHTDSLSMGQLLRDNRWGDIMLRLSAEGSFAGEKPFNINVKGDVPHMAYEGYTINGKDIEAKYTHGARPRIALKGLFGGTCPAIGENHKWNNARFSVALNGDMRASTFNNAIGYIKATNISLTSAKDTFAIRNIEANAGYQKDKKHFVSLSSDFIVGKMIGNPKEEFMMAGELSDAKWLKDLFNIPFDMHKSARLFAKTERRSNKIIVTLDVPSFVYAGKEYRDAMLTLARPNDSLECNIKVNQLLKDGTTMTMKAIGHSAGNDITATVKWGNDKDATRLSGEISANGRFDVKKGNLQEATLSLLPSHVVINNALWTLSPAEITYSKNNTSPTIIDIKGFTLRNDRQQLSINGRISNSPKDSMRVRLREIDVAYILGHTNFRSVSFGGKASGNVYIKTPFSNLAASGGLMVNRFTFQNADMGVLDASVRWNNDGKRIEINGFTDRGPHSMTHINGYVALSPSYIDLDIKAQGTNLALIGPFIKSFAKDVAGDIHGDVKLAGPLKAINLYGDATVNGEVFLKTLGCKYYLKKGEVKLTHNKIHLVNVPLYDIYNNNGTLSGFINHRNLGRISYDLNASIRNLLAYNFDSFGENKFYGTVFATGDASIRGKSGELSITVNAKPERGSSFTYNVADQSSITNREFIQWNSRTNTSANTVTVSKQGKDDMQNKQRSDLRLKFFINTTPDFTLRLLMNSNNDYITLNGNGALTAEYYNKGAFSMFGTYNVERGTYEMTIQDILKKNFSINDEGTIVFGGDPFNAALSLQATHTVNGVSLSDLNMGNSYSSSNTTKVNCLMNITGTPMQPIVNFDIDLPTASNDERQMIRSVLNSEDEMNQQVIYLLGIGRFYPQGTNNAETQDRNETSLAMQSLLSGTISGQISEMLNNVIKSDKWDFGANISTGNDGWSNAEYEGLLSGRLLNNRLLINGQFGYRDNVQTDNASFIGDFDISYLLLPNGNLSIRAYNQTNDRYFTKSSLSTQGAGISVKKDFTNLYELFGIKKRKKKEKSEDKEEEESTPNDD